MQSNDCWRARKGQGVSFGIKADLAVAEDIVLVGAGDLGAAHPHGVFGGSISRGIGDDVGKSLVNAQRPL